MKYSEATKLIKGLSKKYSINNDKSDFKSVFELIYKSKPIAWVDKLKQFNFGRVNISASKFNELPYSHKLWMILAELDMTPLDKRIEHKWNIIVGNDDSDTGSIALWEKASLGHGYILGFADPDDLSCYDAIFTDEEFSDLIKYIKTLPDGEWQAKVAEHGKTEAKSNEN